MGMYVVASLQGTTARDVWTCAKDAYLVSVQEYISVSAVRHTWPSKHAGLSPHKAGATTESRGASSFAPEACFLYSE